MAHPRFGGLLFAAVLSIAAGAASTARCQTPDGDPALSSAAGASQEQQASSSGDFLQAWEGQVVRRISFEGVTAERLDLPVLHLAQAEGAPLTEENVKRSLRQLFATGLYESLEVAGSRQSDGVALVFRGQPRTFIGYVSVYGAIGATMNTQLERATQLEAGTRLTGAKIERALSQMRTMLAENGYREPTITHTVTPTPGQSLADISFLVASGPRAHVGKVAVTGDPGMKIEDFRRLAHLRAGSKVDRDTDNRALDGVLRAYQRQGRLEAEVKLESTTYDPATKTIDFHLTANRGPAVSVSVVGASIDPERVRRLIPIYEEGSVDEDLLNEGNRRLRDYYQRLGYFDVKVSHERKPAVSGQVSILYTVQLGQRRSIQKVSVDGNRYFSTATLIDQLGVHPADILERHGIYNQGLVSADVNALESLYRNNGFSHVKVTAETINPQATAAEESPVPGAATRPPARTRTAPFAVIYHIDEGPQQRVGSVQIDGNRHIPTEVLITQINTAPGQMLSPRNLSGDRDALATEYYSRGFDQADVTVAQQIDPADSSKVNVFFHITEGEQVFIRNVMLTGLRYTRPGTVARAITVHAGDPLDQAALSDTQRNLYSFALFNEVNTAIMNPTGGELRKTVLLQTNEARRWALTYGFGFEAQTGQPQNNCAGAIAGGVACSPNGKTGVSPRVLFDVTRNGLFGREQSASLRSTYGLLEQSIGVQYQIPHFEGDKNLSFTFSGGYANSEDVSTYVASRLEGAFRFTQNFNHPEAWISRANTFIYEIDFRRVKVAASSLQVYPGAISGLSTATRVGGPAFTWIRDTRDTPMDAHRGTYTSFQEFLSTRTFGADALFNRIDTSNSNYLSFGKNRFVLARSTRYGQIRSYGSGASAIIPLPERLYAGGAASMRGFSQNAAGPRDPETGFQIGGAGTLINNTELRLPPPTLPWFGNAMSFVLFHDMGNVFTNAGDAWSSILRVHQPNSSSCRKLATVGDSKSYEPNGDYTSTGHQGDCSFNDFSHTLGLGLRYHTPVGPIRLDFSYNLNPPIYPVNINYSIPVTTATPNGPYQSPYLGQAQHFNFFFSLGQAF